MSVKKQICNLVLILCMMSIAIVCFGTEFHETIRAFRSFQASRSEITEPCSCQKKPILFTEEKLTDMVSSAMENISCRENRRVEFLRQLLSSLCTYLALLVMLLRRYGSAVCQFSSSPTWGLVCILRFIQNADGRKKHRLSYAG